MKMDQERFEKLKNAINAYRKECPNLNPRYVHDFEKSRRWKYFSLVQFDLMNDDNHPAFAQDYKKRVVSYDPQISFDDLSDEHIDTALRNIMAEEP